MDSNKLWANSGDSHLVEPDDLFETRLPAHVAERMPRSVKDPDGSWETVYVDGQEFRRRMPKLPDNPEEFQGLDGSMGVPQRLGHPTSSRCPPDMCARR
jgi:hypothetical protein